MPKPLKWIAIILGSLVAVVVVLFASLLLDSVRHQRREYAIPPEKLALATAGDRALGTHFVQVGCVGCHGADLGGQIFFNDAKMGTLWSRNLTKGEGGVGRTLTRADWVRALRYGVGPDGRTLLMMPTNALEHLSDEDLASIILVIDSVPPVNRDIPAPTLGPLARVLSVTVPFPLFSAEQAEKGATHTKPPATDTLAYGGYLAEVAGCHECHGTTLANGAVGPNITLGGKLAGWTEADFFRAIREGRRPDGTALTDQMPWKDFRKLTDQELNALWRYVQTVPPVTPPKKK